jgi:tRNA (mo5U34)-methyltransferase
MQLRLLRETMSKACNPAFAAETQRQIGRLEAEGWYHSIRFPDGRVTRGHQSEEQLRARLAQFPIPKDLTGKRVLDIGAWDGWFSFELERRGANVVAVDVREFPTFLEAREALGSKVEYCIDDVTNLTPERYGTFDIVLLLGVLYHLKHPLLALERVCALSTGMVCIESYVLNASLDAPPAMEFYEGRELCGQFDNWVGPNLTCLLAFCRAAGFARVELGSVIDQRAHVTCFRKWPERAGAAGEAPRIVAVEKISGAGEYASLWFKSGVPELAPENVFVQVGGFGARPVTVDSTGGDGWLANFRIPPGLDNRLDDVRVAVTNSPWSEPLPAAAPGQPQPLEIVTVTDGKTWERGIIRRGPAACVSLWVRGIPPGTTPTQVEVVLKGRAYPAAFVSRPDAEGLTQVNAILPADLNGESCLIAVRHGAERSQAQTVEIR